MNREDWAVAQKAETLRLSNAHDRAIEIFQQLQKKSPDSAWINAHLGAIYRQLMDYRQAEDYLIKAIAKNDKYYWAHAQLGETYRLRAITENNKAEKNSHIDSAIEHFEKALNDETPEDSNYAWALAHLGATYRLKITNLVIQGLRTNPKSQQSNLASVEKANSQIGNRVKNDKNTKKALECLNRAIELIPTYSWAWGMRATVYRLAQKYEASFWDLGVLTVIAPEIEVLQHSSSPVSFLTSRWVNLHEHAFLAFYLTKKKDKEEKKRHYGRAIAYAQQALQVQPGDSIAQLILLVIEANQKKESNESNESLGSPPDFEKIEQKLKQFFKYTESQLFETSIEVLRHLIALKRIKQEELEHIINQAEEHHVIRRFIRDADLQEKSIEKIDDNEAQLWLWKNFALTQTCSSVLWLLSDLSEILPEDSIIGSAEPYRVLAGIINFNYTSERLYQTPVLSDDKRYKVFGGLSRVIAS